MTSTFTLNPTVAIRPRRSLAARLLTMIVKADARYRQASKLNAASDENLADMGLTRSQADAAFYGRYRSREAKDQPKFGF